MPFLIRPPLHSAVADDPSSILTLIEPDHNDRSMLKDLMRWDWRITRHDFDDDEFIEALKEVEQDLKRRHRHTHAMGEDLVGYTPRPTLEDVWHDEAEKKLMEEAYAEEEEERKAKAEGNWLKHIDRTHQTNGFLDYVDHEQERPRLVTRGLDHTSIVAFHKPARVQYLHQHPSYKARIYSTAPPSRTVWYYIKRPRAYWNKPAPGTPQHDDNASIRVTTNIRMSPVVQDHDESPNCESALPPVPRSPSLNLFFPGARVSQSTYIHHTNTALQQALPPLPRDAAPVQRADPYGWDAWDEQRQRNLSARASVKFFLGRERSSMNSQAWERSEKISTGTDGKRRWRRRSVPVEMSEGTASVGMDLWAGEREMERAVWKAE